MKTTSTTKLCGCKEKCFEKGECWGHLCGVMCAHLEEKSTSESTCVTICGKTKEEVLVYTNQREHEKVINKVKKLRIKLRMLKELGDTCKCCGTKFVIRTAFEQESLKVGKVKVFDIEYKYCPTCKEEHIPQAIMNKWDAMEKHLILNRLARSLNTIEDINDLYVPDIEVAKLLNISIRRLRGKSLDMSILRNSIYNIQLFGKRYFLKKSLDKFIAEKNGIFMLK